MAKTAKVQLTHRDGDTVIGRDPNGLGWHLLHWPADIRPRPKCQECGKTFTNGFISAFRTDYMCGECAEIVYDTD